jgi:hypothetical protein
MRLLQERELGCFSGPIPAGEIAPPVQISTRASLSFSRQGRTGSADADTDGNLRSQTAKPHAIPRATTCTSAITIRPIIPNMEFGSRELEVMGQR